MIKLNSFILKIFALATMILDHYGAIFQPSDVGFRIIGRLAFPIYAFLLVEGFTHTGNLRKYGKRLLIFALLSEIPFDYAFYGAINWSHQNIFFTLFIGLVAMYVIENKANNKNTALIAVGAGILATIFASDYNFIGIIYILSFYYSRNLTSTERMAVVAAIMFITNILSTGWIQQYALLALPLILFYNGKPGLRNKALQYIFYMAYPFHLLIFAIIKGNIVL